MYYGQIFMKIHLKFCYGAQELSQVHVKNRRDLIELQLNVQPAGAQYL